MVSYDGLEWRTIVTALQGFNLRKAEPTDIPKIQEINLQTLPENYPDYFFRDIYDSYSEAFWVIESEGNLVGYIMCRMEGGISHFGLRWVKRGHVVSVAILPEYRRKGLATQLINQSMQALIKEYNAKEIILEVRISNIPAIKLYEKLGFQRIRVLKTYYRNGEDAQLMAMKTT